MSSKMLHSKNVQDAAVSAAVMPLRSQPAIKTIARLKRTGLATARPYRGVFLTEKGEALAERVRIRHRLVVDVLCALGVPTESAEADAEGIEHHVSETTLKAFAHFVKSQR